MGLNPLLHLHNSITGLINRTPELGGNSGEECSSICCALFGRQNLNFVVVDVGLNLSPEWGACTAASKPDISNRDLHLLEKRESVLETERYTFQDGARHVRTSVAGGKSRQCATRIGIEMRSAFSHEIGRPQDSV